MQNTSLHLDYGSVCPRVTGHTSSLEYIYNNHYHDQLRCTFTKTVFASLECEMNPIQSVRIVLREVTDFVSQSAGRVTPFFFFSSKMLAHSLGICRIEYLSDMAPVGKLRKCVYIWSGGCLSDASVEL